MDKFAVYLVSKDRGAVLRVTCVAREGAVHAIDETTGFTVVVDKIVSGTWVRLGEQDATVAAELLALALALGQPPTLAPVGDQPDMPVWVVMDGVVPTVLLASLHRRLCDTSNDQRTLAARA